MAESKNTVGNPDEFTGNIRTRLMAIDPTQVGQFNQDGSVASLRFRWTLLAAIAVDQAVQWI